MKRKMVKLNDKLTVDVNKIYAHGTAKPEEHCWIAIEELGQYFVDLPYEVVLSRIEEAKETEQ